MRRSETRPIRLAALRDRPECVVRSGPATSLLDLGDGCLCFEVHTPRNVLDDAVVAGIGEAVEVAQADFSALVVGNEGEHFSTGADLATIYRLALAADWPGIEARVRALQEALQALRRAPLPVVAAPFLYTLGGGLELAMAADRCQAHSEIFPGLVETAVGLVPAGGGCLRMVERWADPVAGVQGGDVTPFLAQAALNIVQSKVASGVAEARQARYLAATDSVSAERDLQLAHAKHRALELAAGGYEPPPALLRAAAGRSTAEAIERRLAALVVVGVLNDYDARIGARVVAILCGGDVPAGTPRSEQDFLDLEREAFLSLAGEERTLDRLRGVLEEEPALKSPLLPAPSPPLRGVG